MIKASFWRYLHEAGSKEYRALHLRVDDKSVVIFAWGKVRRITGTKIMPYDRAGNAENAINRKLKDKAGRGYEPDLSESAVEIASPDDLAEHVGLPARRLMESLRERLGASVFKDLEVALEGGASGSEKSFSAEPHVVADDDGSKKAPKQHPLWGQW